MVCMYVRMYVCMWQALPEDSEERKKYVSLAESMKAEIAATAGRYVGMWVGRWLCSGIDNEDSWSSISQLSMYVCMYVCMIGSTSEGGKKAAAKAKKASAGGGSAVPANAFQLFCKEQRPSLTKVCMYLRR